MAGVAVQDSIRSARVGQHLGPMEVKDGLKGGAAFLVPTDLPGITRGKPIDKLGQRTLPQGEMFVDECPGQILGGGGVWCGQQDYADIGHRESPKRRLCSSIAKRSVMPAT